MDGHTHHFHVDRLYFRVYTIKITESFAQMKQPNEHTKWRLFAISADVHTIFVAHEHFIAYRYRRSSRWREQTKSDNKKVEDKEDSSLP